MWKADAQQEQQCLQILEDLYKTNKSSTQLVNNLYLKKLDGF